MIHHRTKFGPPQKKMSGHDQPHRQNYRRTEPYNNVQRKKKKGGKKKHSTSTCCKESSPFQLASQVCITGLNLSPSWHWQRPSKHRSLIGMLQSPSDTHGKPCRIRGWHILLLVFLSTTFSKSGLQSQSPVERLQTSQGSLEQPSASAQRLSRSPWNARRENTSMQADPFSFSPQKKVQPPPP